MKRLEERCELDETKAMMLYLKGESDAKIARRTGVSAPTVAKWRNVHMLAPNYGKPWRGDEKEENGEKKRPRRKEPVCQLAEDAMAAAEMGMSYGEFKAKQHAGRIKDEARQKAIFDARKKAKAEREAAEAAARAVPDYGGAFDCACISEGL